MPSIYLLSLIASLYLCQATPLTSLPPTIVPRASTDCDNVTAGLDEVCWDAVPPNVGMQSWLNTWNKTTTTCKPGEVWANCFMREAGVTSNTTEGIRCDLIGPDACPEPTPEVFADASVEASYGIAGIWALQQYMTTLYQYITDESSFTLISDAFFNQTAPRSSKTILINILNQQVDDELSAKVATLITSPVTIGQGSFVIPTQAQAQRITGETVGYLLQWVMTQWVGGGFSALAVNGTLISILGD